MNGHSKRPPPRSDDEDVAWQQQQQQQRMHRFAITLSIRFLFLSFTLSCAFAFIVGWSARLVLLSQIGNTGGAVISSKYGGTDGGTGGLLSAAAGGGEGMSHKLLALSSSNDMENIEEGELSSGSSGKPSSRQLPAPKVIEGKDVPFTTYASKTFQMAGASTSHTLHIDRTGVIPKDMMSRSRKEFDGGPDFQTTDAEEDGWVDVTSTTTTTNCESKTCSRGKESSIVNNDDHNDDSDGLHLPAGQHLLVDIKDVDSNFLNSEERLASAMIEVINESKLTLLSYHCHSLVPIGVSCAGVLLESHVAFHTWPAEGVITMDVFTCGGGLLVPMLPSLYRLFGIASEKTSYDDDEDEDEPPQPTMLWSHKLRGFREGFAPGYVRSTNPLDGSLGRYVLGKLDFDTKRPLLSTRTNYQSVNIYEVANLVSKSRDVNMDGIRGDPDKILFLDGIIQSTLYGDAPYHESIVHPAMLVHPNPQRIAIIGGGEGATLREVLKHRSVTEVVIFEIDEELVNICREFMSEWSDCSDIDNGGSSASADVTSCFDDPRASVIYTDAFQWFVDRLSTNGNETSSWLESEKKFDVIIMDALDPKTSLEIAGGLYDDTSFVDSLFDALIEDGVFVVQMGKSRMLTDPHDEVGRFKQTGLMIKTLEQSGFESIHTYDEGHSHFYMPWSYLVALKDYETKAAWHRTAPEIQIELHQRLHRTKSGNPILRYFDVAMMVGYQVPSKAQEMTQCREDMNGKVPMDCDDILGFYKQDRIHLPLDHIQVAKSGVGERAGRGLFAAQDIPEFATIGLEKSVQ